MDNIIQFNLAKTIGLIPAITICVIKDGIDNDAIIYNERKWYMAPFTEIAKHTGCLTPARVRRGLQKLAKSGYIIIDNHNEAPLNHTRWYSLTDKGEELFQKGAMMPLFGFLDGNIMMNSAIWSDKRALALRDTNEYYLYFLTELYAFAAENKSHIVSENGKYLTADYFARHDNKQKEFVQKGLELMENMGFLKLENNKIYMFEV